MNFTMYNNQYLDRSQLPSPRCEGGAFDDCTGADQTKYQCEFSNQSKYILYVGPMYIYVTNLPTL